MGSVRGWLIVLIGALGMSFAAETCATPLYGGYNGESKSWVEYKIGEVETSPFAASIFLGADTDDRSWTRMRISLVPLFARLEYTRDYLGRQSVVFNTLFPWPIQIGSEIPETLGESPLWWVTAYLLLGVGGIDSEGNSWSETGIPGVYGMGADISGDQWFWYKGGNLLQGFGEDFTDDLEGLLRNKPVPPAQKPLLTFKGQFDEYLAGVLAERLSSDEFVHAAEECSESLHALSAYLSTTDVSLTGAGLLGGAEITEMRQAVEVSCGAAGSELFTGKMQDRLAILLDGFVREVQPLLGKNLSH